MRQAYRYHDGKMIAVRPREPRPRNPAMARHVARMNRHTWVMRITHTVGIALALTLIALLLSIPGPTP